jgi:hypothetical protein
MVPSQAFNVLHDGKGYMAIGPESTKGGNEMWVLHGGLVPFVLKDVGKSGKWALVGDAYVHGIMDGEGWKEDSTCKRVWLCEMSLALGRHGSSPYCCARKSTMCQRKAKVYKF